MLPSWSEFWLRVGESWSWIGDWVTALGLPRVPFFILTVILPAVVYAAGVFFLLSVIMYINFREDRHMYTLGEVLLTVLAGVGLVLLAIIYVSFCYGVFGTEKSIQGAVIYAVLMASVCLTPFEGMLRREHNNR